MRQNQSIIGWLPSGDAFMVRNSRRLEAEILQYFRTKKLSTFTRNLNLCGFKRTTDKSGAYHHEMFHRDKPERCNQMKPRRKSRAKANPNLNANEAVVPMGHTGIFGSATGTATAGAQIISRRIEVYWPDDSKYHVGTVSNSKRMAKAGGDEQQEMHQDQQEQQQEMVQKEFHLATVTRSGSTCPRKRTASLRRRRRLRRRRPNTFTQSNFER